MNEIVFDLNKTSGKIKPVNAVNNGPAGSKVRGFSSFDDYAALEIPYARTHDASFYSAYGGEHTVDVHRIFPRFELDENDPASYRFEPTDKYLTSIDSVGTKVFYRLGASIEHGFKEGTYPPKDYLKWAKICEHIIRHYTEGWANGYKLDIEYWEIWNEPECCNPDGSNPCWQGTFDEFIDFYEVAAKYLKSTFPHLKIGGPAFCQSYEYPPRQAFLKAVKEREMPLDFYSFHGYLNSPEEVYALSDAAVKSFADAGLEKVEFIYNEWNYVREWVGPAYVYSRKMSKLNKGASLIGGTMCAGQESDIDMLMYYDARPGAWCGIFDSDHLDKLKPYYTFYMFRELPRLGTYVPSTNSLTDIYTCCATNGKSTALYITHYNDEDTTPAKMARIAFKGVKSEKGVKVEYLLLDDNHDAELVREEYFTAESFTLILKLNLFDGYLIRITQIED